MIIQLHTPEGIVDVDTDTATDTELTKLGLTRQTLNELIPRDLAAEIDEIRVIVEKLEKLKKLEKK